MVKNRSQNEVDKKMNLSKLHEMETEYFQENAPWNSIRNKKCLGIRALANELSQRLLQRIEDFLPTIEIKINEKFEDCEIELKKLGDDIPEDINGKYKKITDLIRKFSQKVTKVLQENEDQRLWESLHENFENFRDEIWETKELPKSEEYFEELKNKILKFRGEELPLFPSYSLAKHEINQIVKLWEAPAFELLENIYDFVQHLLFEIADESLGQFKNFSKKVKLKLKIFLQKIKENIKTKIQEDIRKLGESPFTQNDYYHKTVLNILGEHFAFPTEADFIEICSQFGTSSFKLDIRKETLKQIWKQVIVKIDLNSQLEDQQFEITHTHTHTHDWAIQLQAAIEAYMQVAYKRHADEIPHEMISKLQFDLKNELQMKLMDTLLNEIDVDGPNGIFMENPQVKKDRQKLKKDLQSLSTCQKILNEGVFFVQQKITQKKRGPGEEEEEEEEVEKEESSTYFDFNCLNKNN